MSGLVATSLGTPRAASWDDAWLALVEETEHHLGRAICGAHAPDGEPCELGSTHPNGRCRFHGGHPRIGAQPGNTNALVHGLYSRRLRQCNDTCPIWQSCPFSGADVMALSERKRPVCAYEREAFNLAMRIPAFDLGTTIVPPNSIEPSDPSESPSSTDSADTLGPLPYGFSARGEAGRREILTLLRGRNNPFFTTPGITTKFPRPIEDPVSTDQPESAAAPERSRHCEEGAQSSAGRGNLDDPAATHLPPEPAPDPAATIVEDTGAILFAMLQRATLTVSAQHGLTETTEADGPRYSMRSTKMSAALGAFLRIGRELRAWLRLRPTPTAVPAPAEPEAPKKNAFGDTRDRPKFNEKGYVQFYDHEGNIVALGDLIHPFLHELDATVEQLRQEGITIPPPDPNPSATDQTD